MESMTTDEYIRKRTLSDESVSLRNRRGQYTQPNSPSSVKLDPDSDTEEWDEYSHGDRSREESVSMEVDNQNSPIETSICSPRITLLFIFVCLPILLYWFWSLLASGSDSSSDTLIYNQMTELEKSFPGQNPRFWRVLKTTIVSRTRTSSSSNENAEIFGAPKVLLISPSSDPAKNESYQQFLRHFENSLGNMRHHWKCAVIDPVKSHNNISPERIKRNMHDQMEEAYRSGRKCLHVLGIDRLSGDAALALHGNTDPLNSPFKDAFLLFSIQKPPEISSQTSHRQMETALRDYLRSLWEQDLGGDETYALINRLTGRIGIFEIGRN